MEVLHADNNSTVVVASELVRHHIESLYAGKVSVICIPNFFAYKSITTQKIINSPSFGTYNYIPNVGRLGITWQEGLRGDREEYFSSSPHVMRHIRDIFDGLSPLDKLRLELDEVWGSNLLRVDDKPMFAGIVRYYSNAGNALPHQDTPDEIPGVIKQIAANIYLSSPDQGGEIELWSARLTSNEYNAIRVNYGVDRTAISPPALTLRPQTGDLIFFDTSKIHAVRKVSGDSPRVSQGVFCGLTQENSIMLWS